MRANFLSSGGMSAILIQCQCLVKNTDLAHLKFAHYYSFYIRFRFHKIKTCHGQKEASSQKAASSMSILAV